MISLTTHKTNTNTAHQDPKKTLDDVHVTFPAWGVFGHDGYSDLVQHRFIGFNEISRTRTTQASEQLHVLLSDSSAPAEGRLRKGFARGI